MANFFDQFDAPRAAPPQQPANFFDQFDTSTAEDVAKSVPSGLAKGAVGLAGLPGDLQAIGERYGPGFSEWLTRKADELFPRYMEYQRKNASRYPLARGASEINPPSLPRSSEIRRQVEKVTGEFYEPKTTPGRYTQAAAEFVPGAVAGPGGIARNVAGGAITGVAAEGAGDLPGVKGTPLEPWVKVAAGLGMGGLTAIVSQPRTAERFIRAQLPDYVTERAVTEADALVSDAARRGVTLTWPEALSQVTGRPVLNDMQRILEGSKRTRATMQQALGDRPAQIAGAADQEVARIAPPTNQPSTIGPAAGETAESAVNDVREAINRRTQPFYDAAEREVLTPAEMRQVTAMPGWDEAVRAVRSDPQLNRYVGHLPTNSVGFLNEVKKYLDQQAANAARPLAQSPNMQRAAGYGRDATTARGVGVGASRDYATALALQQHLRETYLDPLLQGPLGKLADKDLTTKKALEALFPAEPLAGSADEVSTAVSALAARRPEVARQLVRAHVEAKLDEAFNAAGRSQEAAGFAGAGAAQRLVGSPAVLTQRGENFRAAVEALPGGRQIWPGVQRFLDIAQATGWRQPIGSKTAFNEAELHGMATGKALANLAKTAASPGEWWHLAHEMWGKWQTGNNLDALARIITDPRSAETFRRIARMPANADGARRMAARVTFAVGAGTTVEDRVGKLAPPQNKLGNEPDNAAGR